MVATSSVRWNIWQEGVGWAVPAREGLYPAGMSDSTRLVIGARTLTEDERAELVRLIVGGSWRVLGASQNPFSRPTG